MTCRCFQYKEGESYETKENPVKCTANGFHSCENPVDVFKYYEPSQSIFREVEVDGATDRDNGDSKIASSKIKIGAEISFKSICEAGIKFVFEKADWSKKENHTKEESSASSATGDSSASSATGDSSASSATGYRSASSATGDRSASSATGDNSASSATGYSSASSATGDSSASLTNGFYSSSEIKESDKFKNSVAIATGYESKVRAPLGAWVVCAEWDKKAEEILWIKTAQIDGAKLKANTWYTVKNGKFVEV